jgi:hypothetical protein
MFMQQSGKRLSLDQAFKLTNHSRVHRVFPDRVGRLNPMQVLHSGPFQIGFLMFTWLYHKFSDIFAIFHFSHSSWHQLRSLGRIHLGYTRQLFAGNENQCCKDYSLQSFGDDARPKFRIMAKQTSFLHGEGRTLREYRIAGFELACFLVVQQQKCSSLLMRWAWEDIADYFISWLDIV